MPILLDLSFDGYTSIVLGPASMLLAYLDPGTGSYFLQILLASLFGGMFALKQSWTALKFRFFGRDPLPTCPAPSIPQRPTTRDRSNDLARPGVHVHRTAKFQ